MMWRSKSASFSWIVVTKPGKLARSCVCSVFIVCKLEIRNSKSTLPLQPSGCVGPKSSAVPTSRSTSVLMPSALPEPAESSAVPVVEMPPLVELPPVDADADVTPGPVEKPGGDGSPQAAKTRAARVALRIVSQA
jgi:hypothetical protein